MRKFTLELPLFVSYPFLIERPLLSPLADPDIDGSFVKAGQTQIWISEGS